MPDIVLTGTPGQVMVADALGLFQPAAGATVALQRTVTLTNNQIKALPTTPIELVPAPGAGKVLVFTRAFHALHLVADYTNVPANTVMEIDWPSSGQVSNPFRCGDTLYFDYGAPAELRAGFTPAVFFADPQVEEAGTDQGTETDNQPLLLRLQNTTGDFTGGHADNSMTFTVLYVVLDLP